MLDPYLTLGLDPDQTDDEAVRKAYTEAIRLHPPDRDPKTFERIREAYEQIKHGEDRIRIKLFGLKRNQSLLEWLPESEERPRVGAEQWLAMIEEEAKRNSSQNPYQTQKRDLCEKT